MKSVIEILCNFWSLIGVFHVLVDYRMYTPNVSQPQVFNRKNVENVIFDSSASYVILFHGWIDGADNDFFANATKKLNALNIVVIQADYHDAMDCLLYLPSVLSLPGIGEDVATIINTMEKKNVPVNKITLVGHSLGAHIAGIAGEIVNKETTCNNSPDCVGKIFGLDPAFPGFLPGVSYKQLSKDDANRVIVFHTSTLGTQFSIGNIDFYPNGGCNQESCAKKMMTDDHNVAKNYFVNSIDNRTIYEANRFTSTIPFLCCPDCMTIEDESALMSFHVDDTSTGNYYADITC